MLSLVSNILYYPSKYFPSPVTPSRSNCYIFSSLFQSELPADPDVEFESQSPYQSQLPGSLDVDFEPPSPANHSDLPVDSRSFSYGIKRRRANATNWVCTIRPKVNIANWFLIFTTSRLSERTTKVQRAAAEDLWAVGPVRGRGKISKKTIEGLLLS